jgi:peptide/nickel transport system ATP-binding protein
LNLLNQLRSALGLSFLFISHDLSVVRHIAERVAVMYLGRIVEVAPAAELYASPQHPYSQALLAEIPRIDSRHRQFKRVSGEIPSPLAPPPGCHFHPRCPYAMTRCAQEAPVLRSVGSAHFSACHLHESR